MKHLMTYIVLALSVLIAAPTFADTTETSSVEAVILYVDINADDAEKMAELLNGVGATKAEAIIEYRLANGPFETVDELMEVPGIGPATLEKNRDIIVLGAVTN